MNQQNLNETMSMSTDRMNNTSAAAAESPKWNLQNMLVGMCNCQSTPIEVEEDTFYQADRAFDDDCSIVDDCRVTSDEFSNEAVGADSRRRAISIVGLSEGSISEQVLQKGQCEFVEYTPDDRFLISDLYKVGIKPRSNEDWLMPRSVNSRDDDDDHIDLPLFLEKSPTRSFVTATTASMGSFDSLDFHDDAVPAQTPAVATCVSFVEETEETRAIEVFETAIHTDNFSTPPRRRPNAEKRNIFRPIRTARDDPERTPPPSRFGYLANDGAAVSNDVLDQSDSDSIQSPPFLRMHLLHSLFDDDEDEEQDEQEQRYPTKETSKTRIVHPFNVGPTFVHAAQ